jgi:hypothetical protein
LINLQHDNITVSRTAINGGLNENTETTVIATGDDRFIAPLYHVSKSGADFSSVVGATVGIGEIVDEASTTESSGMV